MITKHASGRTYNYDYCIGRITTSGAGFWAPSDFALGSGGSLYVISRGLEMLNSHGITKCNLDEDLIWQDRGPGFCNGQCPWPSSVDLDSSENIYISDDYASRVFIYDKDGNFLTGWGRKGSGDGELNGPSGLAFDREDNLYVVDALNHRVQKFSRDGAYLGKWGEQGSGEGQFNIGASLLTTLDICTWWTGGTIGSKSSPRRGNTWLPSAGRARATEGCVDPRA